jgi:hypothetical protein
MTLAQWPGAIPCAGRGTEFAGDGREFLNPGSEVSAAPDFYRNYGYPFIDINNGGCSAEHRNSQSPGTAHQV